MSKRLLIILTVFMVCFGISGAGVFAATASAGTGSSAAGSAAAEGSPGGISQPVLTKLTFTKKNTKAIAVLRWKGERGGTFYIYRRTPGKKYKKIKTVRIKGTEGTFRDKNLNPKRHYRYTVAQKEGSKAGPYDKQGLESLPAPSVKVKYINMYAQVTWKKVKGADRYIVYRKCSDFWEPVETTSGLTYTDWYWKLDEATHSANRITYKEYIDPSYNRLAYTVRAVSTGKVDGQKKRSVGAFLPDGDFHLEQPTIISADYIVPEGREASADLNSSGTDLAAAPAERLLTWGAVPHAQSYRILIKRGGSWKVFANVKGSQTASVLTARVPGDGTYYGVRAIAKKNGTTVKSGYEKHFNVSLGGHADQSVLFIGDSVMAGNPYILEDDNEIYAIPWRVSALTGASVLKKTHGGACYHYQEITDTYLRRSLLIHVLQSVKLSVLAGYDVVILEGGTNDYYSGAALGTVSGTPASTDGSALAASADGSALAASDNQASGRDTGTFCGAFNGVIDYLEEANAIRVEQGLPPLKVVLFDITFSNRVGSHRTRINRDTHQNKRGLTLVDYQQALNKIWDERRNLADPDTGLQFYHYKTRSYGIVTESNCDQWTSDNLHPTKKGYAEYGSSLAKFMIDNGILQ